MIFIYFFRIVAYINGPEPFLIHWPIKQQSAFSKSNSLNASYRLQVTATNINCY